MSLVESEAKARRLGMTYGQYQTAKADGTLPSIDEVDAMVDEILNGPGEPPVSIHGRVMWTPEMKAALRRYVAADMPMAEIASKMGLPVSKVKAQIGYLQSRPSWGSKPGKRAAAPKPAATPVPTPEAEPAPAAPAFSAECDVVHLLRVLQTAVGRDINPDEVTAVAASRKLAQASVTYKLGGLAWCLSVSRVPEEDD